MSYSGPIGRIASAMQESRNYASTQLMRAFAFEQQSKVMQAYRLCQAFLKKHPTDLRARYLQGKLFYRLGDLESAVGCLKKLLSECPEEPEVSSLYFLALIDNAQVELALEEGLRFAKTASAKIDVCLRVADKLGSLLRHREATEVLLRAASFEPQNADVLRRLAAHYYVLQDFSCVIDSCELFASSHKIADDICEFWVLSLGKLQRISEVLEIFNRRNAQVTSDRDLRFAWLASVMLPTIYSDTEEVDVSRDRYIRGLEYIDRFSNEEKYLRSDKTFFSRRPWDNFLFPYLGIDVRYGQELRSKILRRYVSYISKDLLEFPAQRTPASGKIRLGYISGNLNNHTVGMAWYGTYVSHDREKFEIYVYSIGSDKSQLIADFSAQGDVIKEVQDDDPFTLARQIRKDELDVLIYPDIGMESLTSLLCVMRLAPIQCVHWGHPMTTGSKAMDFFLSGELSEPEDAQDHYTEVLKCLPGFGACHCYKFIQQVSRDRSKFGLDEKDFVFASTQSLFKYLPKYDWIYPAIVSRVPSKIIFIEGKTKYITEKFAARMRTAFLRYDLNFDDYCYILPRTKNHTEYLELMQCCDAMLDTPMWAGGRTTLEALSQGLPVVTWPGPYMRAVHTAGILRLMDYDDTVVASLEQYVDIAVQLVNDPILFHRLRQKVKSQHRRAFDDSRVVADLEAFLEFQVKALRHRHLLGVELF